MHHKNTPTSAIHSQARHSTSLRTTRLTQLVCRWWGFERTPLAALLSSHHRVARNERSDVSMPIPPTRTSSRVSLRAAMSASGNGAQARLRRLSRHVRGSPSAGAGAGGAGAGAGAESQGLSKEPTGLLQLASDVATVATRSVQETVQHGGDLVARVLKAHGAYGRQQEGGKRALALMS